MKSHVGEESEEQTGFSIPIPEITLPREDENPKSVGPKLYVRDDGTVDWDGALQDRSALQNFGTAVWARINGQNPEFLSEDEDAAVKEEHGPKAVTVKIEETDDIRAQRAALDSLKVEYDEMEQEHTALLNSGVCINGFVPQWRVWIISACSVKCVISFDSSPLRYSS